MTDALQALVQTALELMLTFVDVIKGCRARLLIENAWILYQGSMLVTYWPVCVAFVMSCGCKHAIFGLNEYAG